MPLASNDAARLAKLKGQTRPQRGPSATLTAALGARTILPGREQEAYEIWRGLLERASSGDAAAGEDMVMLTVLLANELSDKVTELRALTQEALGAARLPRHRQEQLGRLCRLAVREANPNAAFEALSAMTVDPPDIESDSELRVSAAALATLLGKTDHVLAVLGARANDVPIDASLGPISIVLRANAYEKLGQLPEAADALRELPHFAMFADLNATFSVLRLCPQASVDFDQTGVSEHRGVPAPLGTVLPLGVLFLGLAAVVIGALVFSDDPGPSKTFDKIMLWFCIALLIVLGLPFTLGGISARRRISLLRQRGILRRAHVTQIETTGTRIGSIPIYSLTLQLHGPRGGYHAHVRKALSAPQASSIVGTTVSILANPANDTDVILDELEQH